MYNFKVKPTSAMVADLADGWGLGKYKNGSVLVIQPSAGQKPLPR